MAVMSWSTGRSSRHHYAQPLVLLVFGVFIGLKLSARPPPSVSTPSPSGGVFERMRYEVLKDTDFPYDDTNDNAEGLAATSMEECCRMCDAASGCALSVLSGKICYLKTSRSFDMGPIRAHGVTACRPVSEESNVNTLDMSRRKLPFYRREVCESDLCKRCNRPSYETAMEDEPPQVPVLKPKLYLGRPPPPPIPPDVALRMAQSAAAQPNHAAPPGQAVPRVLKMAANIDEFRKGLIIPAVEEIESEIQPPGSMPQDVPRHHRLRLCIGIPSAHRRVSRLLEHMRDLRAEIDLETTVLVLFQTFSSKDDVENRKALEEMGFKVFVDEKGYPDIDSGPLKQNFGDAIDRVRWRTKHALDYANTLERCFVEGTERILMIEDDLQPAHRLIPRMEMAVSQLPSQNFGFVTFFSQQAIVPNQKFRRVLGDARQMFYGGNCDCGAVTLLFRREVVAEVIAVLRANAQERPLDWLIPGWLCGAMQLPCYEVTPNLFQHHGLASTLKDQDRTGAHSNSFKIDG